jgi:peptide/nickel transport system permease protein
MLPFIAKRLLSALLTLLLVSVFTFSLAHLAGDPAISVAGREATAEDVARVRVHYGFDKPIAVQYLAWCSRALVGDFGMSYHYKQSVADMLAKRLPITLTLGFSALLFALVLSLPLGILAATRPHGVIDHLALWVALIGQATPTFWLALLMIIFFGLTLHWLPISGNASWLNFVMPTIALGYFAIPALVRLTRAGMIDALASDYIRTARANGLSTRSILFKHALRNVMIPIVSVSAVQLGGMLGGSIVIEQIYALQGIGWLGYDATVRSDLPVVQAITLIVAAFYILLILLADVLNAILDPRIRVT